MSSYRVPAKGRMGTPHTPFFAREACRRRIPSQSTSVDPWRLFRMQTVSQGGRRSRCPAVRFASTGRAGCAGLLRRWGRPYKTANGSPGSVEAHRCFSFSPGKTPCETRLFTQRPETAYVFTAASRSSFTTGAVQRSYPLISAVHSLSALRALRSFAAPLCRAFLARVLAFTLPCLSLPEPPCFRHQELQSVRLLHEYAPLCLVCGHPLCNPFTRWRLRQPRGNVSLCQEDKKRSCSVVAIVRKVPSLNHIGGSVPRTIERSLIARR